MLNLSYTMHVTCHIHYLCFTYVFLTNKLYLCLIIHFITFNLLLFNCLNDRARIAPNVLVVLKGIWMELLVALVNIVVHLLLHK